MISWVQLSNLPDHLLFGAPAQGTGRRARLLRVARYPYAMLRDLIGGRLNLYAISLVYATVLALIPLLAFSFALLKAFGGAHRLLEPLVFDFFQPMGAAAGEFTQRVMGFADKVRSGLVGSVGLAALIWTLIGTLKKVEDGLNYVWHVEEARNLARRVADYLVLIVTGPLAIAAVVSLSRAAARSAPLRLLSTLPLLDRLDAVALQLAPFVIVAGLLSAIYFIVPNTRVRIGPALAGGACAGVLWAAVGRIFTLFVLYSSRLTIVYAGFAIFVAALLWAYLGWIIMLLGAQLSFYLQNPGYLRLGLRQLQLSGADSVRLALGIMYLVAHDYQRGRYPWTVGTLAARLGAPANAIARLCQQLETAGLLTDTRRDALLPGRDPAHIPLLQIVQTIYHHGSGHLLSGRQLPPRVEALGERLEQAWEQYCAGRSLADLVATEGATTTAFENV